MFKGQKLDLIKDILIEQNSVSTSTLSGILNVSEVSVRKYFDILEKEGFLIKVYGGAILANAQNLSSAVQFDIKTKEIASLAISLLVENETIFLGPGLLCTEFAKQVPPEMNISVMTNNIDAASALSITAANVFSLGGQVKHDDDGVYTYGFDLLSQLRMKHFSKALISPYGIDLKAGVTTNDTFSLELMQIVMSSAKDTVIVANQSSFNRIGIHHIAPVEQFTAYVTDCKIPDIYKEHLFSNNVKLLTSFDS